MPLTCRLCGQTTLLTPCGRTTLTYPNLTGSDRLTRTPVVRDYYRCGCLAITGVTVSSPPPPPPAPAIVLCANCGAAVSSREHHCTSCGTPRPAA